MAALPYGEGPIAAAAASGWRVGRVVDTATSRKHPASFVVLTKTVYRTATRAAGGFGSYPSVRGMRSGKNSIVVGFDTEFVGADSFDAERGWIGESEQVTRRIVSYQFAAIDPTNHDRLRLAVILPTPYHGPLGRRVARLSFGKALELATTALGLHEHPLAEGWTVKGVPCKDVMDANGKCQRGRWFRQKGEHAHALPITLVAHFQNADLTTFVDPVKMHNTWESAYPGGRKRRRSSAGYSGYRNRRLNDREPDILRAVISASAGMVSPKPIEWVLPGENKRWARPVVVSIRDTMAQSGAAKLSELGDAVGVGKLDVPDDWITRMDAYLFAHPAEFLDYASNDAVIALEYVSQMYGEDQEVALTLPTAAARAVRGIITAELAERQLGKPLVGVGPKINFNSVFGGLEKVTKKTEQTVSIENQLAYYRQRELQPLDGAAATWIHACALSFRGGYNMCAEVGLFRQTTHDLDLQSCYPTASSTIWDVDYLHPDGVILRTVNNVELSLDDFAEGGPLTPFVGFVSFEFDKSVAFPCLPVPVEGSMVYPRTSGGARGVWAMAPEVWLALKLGARVTCQIGHFGRTLRLEDGSPSRLLRRPYKTLLDDRARAKKEFGKKSFQQSVLKLMANSPYGKLAQGVMGQRGWDAWAQERDEVGGSAITSPWHASMTTSLSRAVLLATLNDLNDRGYSTPSCTTDGFITDAELVVVDGLELYGLSGLWRETREALTGSRDMWEEKHTQTDLLNVTTRANFSRQPCGVLAHGGYKLPEGIEVDSQEDRDHMYDLMASREGALPVTMKVFPSIEELTRVHNRLDFSPIVVDKQQTIEFDRKRRPVPDGMTVDMVMVDDEVFEVAHVQTVPWGSPEECELGRSVDGGLKRWDEKLGEPVWERSPVRRTRNQWLDYFDRLDVLLDEDGQIAEAERLDRISKGIVIAYRQGVIDIPWLGPDRPLADRLNAFGKFGLPKPKERFWSHARSKAERQIEVDFDAIAPYAAKMQASDPFAKDTDEQV
ncbi:DNA-directed DNA polymerase [Corynebacterium heidelbergense]|uniref:DNA-directed DNA polymerase n=1 Tax=Corynebacterium heidelbergense TaxID=2055947 RepID=A0A364VDR0_9CORY|nr:DNA-directed DNA polymerase [Corynebacterium heidelbergense]